MHSVETLSAFCLSAAQPMLSLASSGSRVYLIVVLVMLKQTFNIQKIVNKYNKNRCMFLLFIFVKTFQVFHQFGNQCDAMRCDAAMPCHAMPCHAMRYDAMRCDVMRCNAMRCDEMRCNTIRCNAIRCDSMRCDAMRHV